MNDLEDTYAIRRYEMAAELLPMRWRNVACRLAAEKKAVVEELRLRVGQPITVLLPEGEQLLSQQEPQPIVVQGDLEQLCDTVTGYSRYAATEMLSRGYLTAQGGFRIGLCGTAVVKDGVNTNLRDISSAVIRIGRERTVLTDEMASQLFCGAEFCSTLILAPPGGGKTTLLRDLIRFLSDGTESFSAHRVSVVDERGEIAAMYHGIAQLSVGTHTDVLDACPKAIGIPLLLRAANPQIIAVDEITAREDLQAMETAMNCGVRFLATIHANDRQDLARRPLLKKILQNRMFDKVITISHREGARQYLIEDLT